ncbi:MAG: pilus assembly PilX N-terminal domain-containing protein [Candidatus Omnitrophica bacterium]|nr:pilus assembly PilX N-terminal domain-containing protein [Candidatus Omnitrophota bacterium]
MFTKNWKILLTKLEDNRGSVLLTTYMLTMVLLILGAAFLVLSSNESRISEVQRKTTQAFYIAEAGIERAIFDLKTDFENSQNWTDGDINTLVFPYHGDDEDDNSNEVLDAGEDTDSDGLLDPHFVLLPYVDTVLNGGSYTVSLENVAGTDDIWIRSTGTSGNMEDLDGDGTFDGTLDDISQTILVYAKIVDLSPWDNAIFGGAGSAGGMVNGNVTIAGSVHILGGEDTNGNGVLDAGEDKNGNSLLDQLAEEAYAIDLSGDAELVGNNYDGLEDDLKDRVPDLETVLFNEENVETLNAELRVRRGAVRLTASSQVGEDDDDGDGDKETVDGTYVTDGFDGVDHVFSDNGYDQAYDLVEAAVEFPSLNESVGVYADYDAYFTAEGYTLTAGELTAVATLSGATPDFTYGNCATNCISMTGGDLYVNGMIYIKDGTLGITGSTVEYTGQGTILVTGNVDINEDLITPEPDLDAVTGEPIPNYPFNEDTGQKNILGIMTAGNINIGTGAGAAQLNIMGLFYAAVTVTIEKQTDIMGSIVSNYFDISNQVPSIWQVPATRNDLPGGLINGDELFMMKVVSWQKVDNP